jgi:hypothetical protein
MVDESGGRDSPEQEVAVACRAVEALGAVSCPERREGTLQRLRPLSSLKIELKWKRFFLVKQQALCQLMKLSSS